MQVSQPQTLTLLSPAKINLYLHLIGLDQVGQHNIDSLMTFTDIGDTIRIKASDRFHFTLSGPFGSALDAKDADSSLQSKNFIVRAAKSVASACKEDLNIHIDLQKNLPVAAGLSGAASNAGALIWGLIKYWNAFLPPNELEIIMREIDSDIALCYTCENMRIEGANNPRDTDIYIPEVPTVLVSPLIPCRTDDVFQRLNHNFKNPKTVPPVFDTPDALFDFMTGTHNDLTDAAAEIVPDITNILSTLNHEQGCMISRLCGSGATCFGLFEDEKAAENAAQSIQQSNPDWWVKLCWIGRNDGRY